MSNRNRRIIVNLDTGWGMPGVEAGDATELVETCISFLTGQAGSQVDSIWWCWGEMNYAPYPSMLLPVNTQYQKWLAKGVDPLRICLDKCRQKGIEAFYTFRINSGNDFQDWAIPLILSEHPDWGIPSPVFPNQWKHFNFSVRDAREYKLAVIREVVENYDFDGFEIDWRCGLINLPLMRAWEYRASLTEFMLSVRKMLRDRGRKKGVTIPLAARVPENVEGCHWDGLDVERWVREGLVDILALGCRNFDVDIEAFRRITAGTGVRLYASIDEHHPSDGYEHPPIEVFRGVAANFWRRGIDGIYAFNFYPVPMKVPFPKEWEIHRRALCEMGSPETLRHKDKVFVAQRRGGGGWPSTSEHFYVNTNAFAQLPRKLFSSGEEEVYMAITVGDDVNADEEHIERMELRVLFSDTRIGERIKDRIRVRINGVILEQPRAHEGWISYNVKPAWLAVGKNVMGLKLKEEVTVEKLEISVKYK